MKVGLVRGWTKHLAPPVAGWQRTDLLDRGLVGEWPFSYGQTGTIAPDFSGYGNRGTINSATWETGRYGSYLHFDGINDYINISDSGSLDLDDDITVELFFRFWDLTSEDVWRGILGKRAVGTGNYFINYNPRAWADNFQLGYHDGGAYRVLIVDIATYFTVDVWYHVVGTFEIVGATTDLTVYLNAEQIGFGNRAGNPQTNADDLVIGCDIDTPAEFGEVDIAMVRIYNRLLLPNEIRRRSEICFSPTIRPMWMMPWGMAPAVVTTIPVMMDYYRRRRID